MEIDPVLKWLLAGSILVYLVVMYGIGYWAERKVRSTEDFLVAGRSLPLSLAWMTLLATWFGAGTLLTAADEVRDNGLTAAALDPLGAGVCLLLAAVFIAGPIWRHQLLTLPDLFRKKYGAGAELLSAIILVPSYFGWIAAQFIALADILQLFFGIPVVWGLLLVAIVGTGYTWMGGMWSVTLTDAVQIILVLLGLVVMVVVVLAHLGQGDAWSGFARLGSETDPQRLILIPTHDRKELVGWLGVFAIGALGNLPGQDLLQRIFAAKSARVARDACFVAGSLYLAFGVMPLVLALAGNLLVPEATQTRILPLLASFFLHPVVAVIFILAVLSAILSTIDSAILSPSSVLAQNVFPRFGHRDLLRGNRQAVLGVATCSLALAYAGESAYTLLESAYELTMVGLVVPLFFALYTEPRSAWPARTSMLVGTGIWGCHELFDWPHFLAPTPLGLWELPISLTATGAGLLAYLLCEPPWVMQRARPIESNTASNAESA
jgi:SSS family solute:Na+ symporter